MAVTFKDNSKQVLSVMNNLIEQSLERIGLEWIKQVTDIINNRYGKPIVDTGRLRASMKYEVDLANKRVFVGSDVEYVPFVELGTVKMAARPMIRPAVLEFIPLYQEIVEKVLGAGFKVYAA